MKKIFAAFLFLLVLTSVAVAADDFAPPVPKDSPDYLAPVPSEDDEVTKSGPNTKFSVVTQMRYDAFQNAQITVSPQYAEDKKNVKIFVADTDNNVMKSVKVPNAKITKYSDGTYSIKFKDTPDSVFFYELSGDLTGFGIITNKEKLPYVIYHYDTEGTITAIEICPERSRSYTYGPDGLIKEYRLDDNFYNSKNKLIKKRKTVWF